MADPLGFGVGPLDRLVGPIPQGGTVLVHHDPAVEAVPFLVQAAASHLKAGRSVVYLVTSRPPNRVRDAIAALGAAPGAPNGQLIIVDAYSPLVGQDQKADYVLADANSPLDAATWLGQAARDHPGAVLLVESLNIFVDRTSPERFLAVFPKVLEAVRRFRMAGLLWAAWPYGSDLEQALQRIDAVLSLKGVEDRVVLNQLVSVSRTPWSKEAAAPSLYKVLPPGGVVLHIPKIVVTGPYGAGKSTFVHAVSGTAQSVERSGTTVALDRGTANLDGVKVEVFGTPGQERFDPLLPTLAGQAVGALVLVDATKPDSFERAKDMLQKIWKRGLHVVIALNKQDLPGALPMAEALERLRAPPGVDVLPCAAADPESALRVLRHLVDKVIQGAKP